MNILFGPFDFIIIALLILFNLFVHKTDYIRKFNWLLITVLVILFLIIIPYFSAEFERKQVVKQYELVEGFNLIYLFFRFPVWWIIGLFELITIKLIFRRKRKTHHS